MSVDTDLPDDEILHSEVKPESVISLSNGKNVLKNFGDDHDENICMIVSFPSGTITMRSLLFS